MLPLCLGIDCGARFAMGLVEPLVSAPLGGSQKRPAMPDPIIIAGHKCERGSEAHDHLLSAMILRDLGSKPSAASRMTAKATRAPGYLGPADKETPDAR